MDVAKYGALANAVPTHTTFISAMLPTPRWILSCEVTFLKEILKKMTRGSEVISRGSYWSRNDIEGSSIIMY